MIAYNTKYGAQFGYINAGDAYERHSKRDFNLLPREKPTISPPEPKKYVIDIPGADGELDYTEALTGDVHYYNRTGEFKYVYIGERKNWDAVYHNLLDKIHGKKMAVILDEDPGGYYYGRFSVGAPEYNYRREEMFITITGNLEPYRYDLFTSTQPWEWDTFSFVTGVIRDYSSIPIFISGGSVELIGSKMPVTPDIIVLDGSISVQYDTDDGTRLVNLELGHNIQNTPDLIFREGANSLTFYGSGHVSIDFRTGIL